MRFSERSSTSDIIEKMCHIDVYLPADAARAGTTGGAHLQARLPGGRGCRPVPGRPPQAGVGTHSLIRLIMRAPSVAKPLGSRANIIACRKVACRKAVCNCHRRPKHIRLRINLEVTMAEIDDHSCCTTAKPCESLCAMQTDQAIGTAADGGRDAQHPKTSAFCAVSMQIKPFVLRRTKDQVLKDLPPKILQDVFVDASPLQVHRSHRRDRNRQPHLVEELCQHGLWKSDMMELLPASWQRLAERRCVLTLRFESLRAI